MATRNPQAKRQADIETASNQLRLINAVVQDHIVDFEGVSKPLDHVSEEDLHFMSEAARFLIMDGEDLIAQASTILKAVTDEQERRRE